MWIALVFTLGVADDAPTVRISNGIDVIAHRPWIVKGTFCAAVILDKSYLVTARHCVDDKPGENATIKVGSSLCAGKADVSACEGGSNADFEGQTRRVKEIYRNEDIPYYDDLLKGGDLALLKVDKPWEFNENVQAVEVESKPTESLEGSLLEVVGWGLTETGIRSDEMLQTVNISMQSRKVCEKQMIKDMNLDPPMGYDVFCAGDKKDSEKSSREGDSGGPILLAGTSKLVGVVHAGGVGLMPYFTGIHRWLYWIKTYVPSVPDGPAPGPKRPPPPKKKKTSPHRNFYVFIVASCIVLVAMVASFLQWMKVRRRRRAAESRAKKLMKHKKHKSKHGQRNQQHSK